MVDRVLHERVAGRARQQQGGGADILHLQKRAGDSDATADIPHAVAVRVESLEPDWRADHRRPGPEHSDESRCRQVHIAVEKQEVRKLAADMEGSQNGVARTGDQAFISDRVELEPNSRPIVIEETPEVVDMHHAAIGGRADHDIALCKDSRRGRGRRRGGIARRFRRAGHASFSIGRCMSGLPASCSVTSHIRRRASSGIARSCWSNARLLR